MKKLTFRRLVAFSVMLFLCAIATYATTLVTDTFVHANANPLPGSWTTPTGCAPLQIVSNAVTVSATSGNNCEISTAVTWPNNQWAQMPILSGTGTGTTWGIAARQDTSTFTLYLFGVTEIVGASNAAWVLESIVNGSLGAVIASGNLGSTIQAGDIAYISAVGTTITAKYCNPTCTTLGSGTDVLIASGKPGIYQALPDPGFTVTTGIFTAGDFGAAQVGCDMSNTCP